MDLTGYQIVSNCHERCVTPSHMWLRRPNRIAASEDITPQTFQRIRLEIAEHRYLGGEDWNWRWVTPTERTCPKAAVRDMALRHQVPDIAVLAAYSRLVIESKGLELYPVDRKSQMSFVARCCLDPVQAHEAGLPLIDYATRRVRDAPIGAPKPTYPEYHQDFTGR